MTEAEPASLLDDAGDNLDPRPHLGLPDAETRNPGGHGERSVAVGTIDMAVWDAVAKIAGKPLFRLLAERHAAAADPRVFVYAAGGYYYPGKDLSPPCGRRCGGYLDRGYTVVKMKIGGADLPEDQRRIEAVLTGDRQPGPPRRRRQRPLRPGDGHRLRQGPPGNTIYSGTRRLAIRSTTSCRRRWPRSIPGHHGGRGENLFSHQDARNLVRYGGMRPGPRDWLQFDCALSYGLCEYPTHAVRAEGCRLVLAPAASPHGGPPDSR